MDSARTGDRASTCRQFLRLARSGAIAADSANAIVDLLPDDPERILVSYYSGDSTYVMRIPLRGQWPRNPMKILTPLRAVQGIVYDSKNNPRYIWGERILGKSGAYVRRKDRWAPL